MKRKERTKLLVHARKTFLHKWAKRFEEEAEMKLLEEPALGLTMVKMRESAQQSLFYLGEVLISEARVECKGVIGIGIIQGNELQKAYDLAVIDAAVSANLKLVKEFEKDLKKEEDRQRELLHKEIQKILQTHVSFETMDV